MSDLWLRRFNRGYFRSVFAVARPLGYFHLLPDRTRAYGMLINSHYNITHPESSLVSRATSDNTGN